MLTLPHYDAIALAVERVSHLPQFTVPLHLVIYGGRLHEERILIRVTQHSLHPVVVRLHHHIIVVLIHILPHLLVGRVVR